MIKTILISSLCLLANLTFAQQDQIDLLIDSLIRKHQVREFRVDVRQINNFSDTTYWLESKFYDAKGNMIEKVSPGFKGKFDRHSFVYDSLNRRIRYRNYDREDTTVFYGETRWTYEDSMHYRKENYYNNELESYTDYTYKVAEDTFWVIEDEYRLKYKKQEHMVSRYRMVGDSLQISEFIDYNEKMEPKHIDTYYDLTRQLNNGYLKMAGVYRVKSDVWDQFYRDPELMKDYYTHPEKYIQMQLDGKFAFEYDEEPHTYEVYNAKGQLIQDGQWLMKKTFEYNEKGQLFRIIHWGEVDIDTDDSELYSGLVEKGYTYYEYDNKGFPVRVWSETPEGRKTSVYYYSFKF